MDSRDSSSNGVIGMMPALFTITSTGPTVAAMVSKKASKLP
ncbi:Uncharacterised protein [Mycobacteroides abscessus subsp. abscessus]|nr:Uncharacterised protein [Mycobacteroides abscessus subsp. abscessus]